MSPAPLISVIVPVYNGEKYVASCLENILSQTYKNLEIIVVDDGSTDNSAAIAATYPVQVMSLQKNSGLSAARNAGLDKATGRYIHFMDVDDAINDVFYEKLAEAVTATGAEVACAGMIHEKRYYMSMLFKDRKMYTGTYDKLKATYVGKLGYVWRYLFSLAFLKEHHLRFEEGRLIEDLMFSLPAVYYAAKLVVVPGALYYYKHNEDSIMTTTDKAKKEKRRTDRRHTKAMSRQFANTHSLKVPGVNAGVGSYLIRKAYRKLGYTLLGKKFINK